MYWYYNDSKINEKVHPRHTWIISFVDKQYILKIIISINIKELNYIYIYIYDIPWLNFLVELNLRKKKSEN